MRIVFIALFWAGLLFGVSFLATPIKFMAPSLTMPVALEIGRATFGGLKWFEFAAAAILLGCLLMRSPRSRMTSGLFVLIAAAMLLQYFVMLPVMDARVEQIVQGATLPISNLHWVYTGVELIKVVLLITMGVHVLRQINAGK